jgi:hypothetical protein
MNPQVIIIENNTYYLSNEVYVLDPSFFPGCQINMRLMIDKKNLKPSDYAFGYIKNEKWVISNMKYARAKLLITTEWVENNVPKMIIYMRKKTVNPMISKEIITTSTNEGEDVNDLYDAPPAPPILYLEDHEMFKDEKGNYLDIEVRGERDHKKCYFKVKDVSIGFEMPSLYKVLINKDKGYNKLHYKYFTTDVFTNDEYGNSKKELFLTYKGMLKVLFNSRSGNAESFQDWAEDILFTVQIGTEDQKNKLVSKIKGVSYETIQELFSINARDMPCVYLTALNTVDVLRNEMNIDMTYANDSVVYKFGLSATFKTRKNGHKQEFKKIDHLINKTLVYYTIIDPLYLSVAENEIKLMLEDYKFKWDGKDEIVIIPKHKMEMVKEHYKNIGIKYSGHTSELDKQINDLKLDIEKINLKHEHELKLKDKDIELLHKEIEYKDKEIQHKERENELLLRICELSKK